MAVQPGPAGGNGPCAQRDLFTRVFQGRRFPALLSDHSDNELIALIRESVPGASDDECREAVIRVRGLCDAVYEVCEQFHDGTFGSGPEAPANAVLALSGKQPGFSGTEYAEAFAAGLLWTAF